LVYSHTDSNNKRHYESFTAPTKAEAEMLAAEYAAKKHRRVRRDMTVTEAIEGYITAKEAVSSPSTIRGYRQMQKHHYDTIGTKKIRSLTSEDMQLFISELVNKELSPKSVRNIYALLTSSVALYDDFAHFRVTLPTRQKKRPESPSDDDVKAYLNAASPDMKKRIALAILGLRRGEICAARYEDIHDGVLHIHSDWVKDKNNKWVLKEIPKTSESDRYIPLPPSLLQMIGEGEGFIVKVKPDTVSRSFERLRDKVGIRFRLHDMRHFFASTAVLLGIPDLYTADMGGWTRGSSSALKSIYQNNIRSMSDYYQNKLVDHMDKIIKEDA
jgi:integrase